MLGEHQDRQAGHLLARGQRGLQPLVGEGGRQPYVHDGDVGAQLQQALEQLGAALHGRDDLEAVRLQQVDQPVPEQVEVFGDEDT